ncbi:hypothetical protein J6590_085054 [Homalodisca vitripennis]|nr:hypothetical protein J6590_085054 [Homalodisca vitripennis]
MSKRCDTKIIKTSSSYREYVLNTNTMASTEDVESSLQQCQISGSALSGGRNGPKLDIHGLQRQPLPGGNQFGTNYPNLTRTVIIHDVNECFDGLLETQVIQVIDISVPTM